MAKRRYRDITFRPETNTIKITHLSVLLLILIPFSPLTSAVTNEHQHYCGKTWPDAFDNCYKPCPTQSDAECASLGNGADNDEWKCFGFTGCVDKLNDGSGGEAAEPVVEDTVVGTVVTEEEVSDSYCGATWTDAMVSCKIPCGEGASNACPSGQTCFAASNCATPLMTLTTNLVVTMAGPDSAMDNTDQGIFGQTLDDYISDSAGGEGGLSLKGVNLGEQSVQQMRRLSANVTSVNHRQLPTGSSALDVSVTVTGEYRPPPYIDLDVICEDSINKNADRVVSTLQERGNQVGRTFFQRVEGIEALVARDFTKRPTRTPTAKPTTLAPTKAPTGAPIAEPSSFPSIEPSTPFPTSEPSDMPSSEPSRALMQYITTGSQDLLSVGGDTTSSFGYMFNVRTKTDGPAIVIHSLEFFTKSTSKMKFELWSRVGSFKDAKGSLEKWDLLAKGGITGGGPGVYTSIPSDKFVPVEMPGGGGEAGTRAFYLTLKSKDLVYFYGEGTEDSDSLIQTETPDIEIWEGEGVLLYPMPAETETMYYRYPRKFLGSVLYDRLPCRPYSAFGVIDELPCPELPTQSPTVPQPTLSPVTPAPTLSPVTSAPTSKPTPVLTTPPTLLLGPESPAPIIDTPAPQFGFDSPTLQPTASKMPSIEPSSSSPTSSPVVRMEAYATITLHDVPERVMSESEVEIFTKTTFEFLEKYTEQTLILDAINLWHQQLVLVDDLATTYNASAFMTKEEIMEAINGQNITDMLGTNATEGEGIANGMASGFADINTEGTDNAMASGFADVNTEGTDNAMASGFADINTEGTDNAMASGFADINTEGTDNALASGFADINAENTENTMSSGFAYMGTESKSDLIESEPTADEFADYDAKKTTDAMAGGFANSGQRRMKRGSGSGGSATTALDKDKLDKIIAFKLKHSDRGPKIRGVQVTLILRIPFTYLPQNLLGRYVSVIVEEHGIELVHSLRKQSSFYSYFKELRRVSSEAIEELTLPPTSVPTSSVQFLALQDVEELEYDDKSFYNMVGLAFLFFWIFLTAISVICLFKARKDMKERMKMEELLSQERSSSKPLIKGQGNYDSESWQSSEEEQTIQSSETSIDTKRSAPKVTEDILFTDPGPNADHHEQVTNDLFGGQSVVDDDSKSVVTNLSSSSKSTQKTAASSATKSLTSAKDKSKSSHSLKASSSRDLKAKKSTRDLKASDDSSSINDDARISTAKEMRSNNAMSKGKTNSNRSIESADDSFDNGEEFKTSSSSKSKRGTTSKSMNSGKSIEPKSKSRSSSSRSLQSDSGRKRHEKKERTIADRLSSFDIV